MIMFADNPPKALSIGLKQYYLCDLESNIFLVNDGSTWSRVFKDEWLDSMRKFSGGLDISSIIPRLENREACRRIIMM